MKENSLKKNFILSMAFQILNIITPLVTAPYISRVLGANAVGIYSYTSSLQLYFSIFAALGTAIYGCREIAIHRNNIEERSKLFWEIEILTIFTSLICMLGYSVLILLNKEYRIYLIILGIKLINTMLDISWFYTGLEELKYVVYKNAFFKILGIILLFILIKKPSDLIMYMLIMCGTTILGTITMWFYLPKFIKKIPIKSLKIFRHFKKTIVYFIPTIATTIYSNVDKSLIGIITNNMKESAYYEQATKILELAKSITFVSLNSLLTSRMSYLYAKNNIEEMKQKIKISIDYILFIGVGMSFGIIGISNRFVPLFFGEGYERVTLFLQIFILIVVITGISNCLETQYFTPAGKRKESTKFILRGTIINIILNIIFIPILSGIGAIISSIIAELIIFLQYVYKSKNIINLRYILKSGRKKIVASLIMLVVILYLDLYVKNNLLAIFLEILCGGLTYFLSLYVLKDDFLHNYVLKIFKQLLTKIKRVFNIV